MVNEFANYYSIIHKFKFFMLCCFEYLQGRTMISSMMFNLDFLTILDEDDDDIFKKKELKENVIEAHF